MKGAGLRRYYVVAYLLVPVIFLIFALQLLFSNSDYGVLVPRIVGLVVVGLGLVLIQTLRRHRPQPYTITLVGRAAILFLLMSFYAATADAFFLVLVGLIGLGFLLAGAAYLVGRRASS